VPELTLATCNHRRNVALHILVHAFAEAFCLCVTPSLLLFPCCCFILLHCSVILRMETVFSEAFKTVDIGRDQIDLTVFDLTQDPGISPERLANTSMLYKDDVPALSRVLQPTDPARYDILNTFATRGRQVSTVHCTIITYHYCAYVRTTSLYSVCYASDQRALAITVTA
jgi:hypothetical protein